MPALSYAHGTVGDAAAGRDHRREPPPHRRALPGDREALVVRHQNFRADLPPALGRRPTVAARGLLAPGRRSRATASASGRPTASSGSSLQYATARIGAILVNINPAYQADELEYVLNQSGVSVLLLARGFRQTDYVAHARRSARPAVPACDTSSSSITTGTRCCAAASRCREAELARREATLAVRRPDQHPVHLRHHRLPQGRDAHAPQHPQQRLLRRPAARLHRARPRLHPGAVLSLLRHGPGQPRLHQPRRVHGRARASAFDPLAVLEAVQAERCTSLYGVPTMFIAELDHPRFAEFDLSSLRTGIMAGAPCPVELMKQVVDADAHAGGRHRLRHDRDVADLDA